MTAYIEQFTGSFKSTLHWHDLDQLWETLRQHNQGRWYLYQIGETPPEITSTHEVLDLFINEIDAILHEEHDEDYCGIVYADSLQEPSMIKIFDPNHLGVVCGFSNQSPLPGWVLSLSKPQDLLEAFPPPPNRRRWWQKLFDAA